MITTRQPAAHDDVDVLYNRPQKKIFAETKYKIMTYTKHTLMDCQKIMDSVFGRFYTSVYLERHAVGNSDWVWSGKWRERDRDNALVNSWVNKGETVLCEHPVDLKPQGGLV